MPGSAVRGNQRKEEVLIEALPYIQKYEGTTFVIKYGGAAMTDPALKETFAKDVTILRKIGIKIIIVHGGGKDITDLANKLAVTSRFVDGLRYTDKEMIDIVLMVLGGKINKEIVALINHNSGDAVGLSGMDNTLLHAERYSPNGKDLGLVGRVSGVNVSFLNLLLDHGLMPVIAPLAAGEDGAIYNINADLAAGAIAVALRAEKLVYLSDIEGVLVAGELVSSLTEEESDDLVKKGAIFGGMIPKVTSAFETLNGGVRKVHLIDGRIKHSLLLEIFTDEGVGTQMIHQSNGEKNAKG